MAIGTPEKFAIEATYYGFVYRIPAGATDEERQLHSQRLTKLMYALENNMQEAGSIPGNAELIATVDFATNDLIYLFRLPITKGGLETWREFLDGLHLE